MKSNDLWYSEYHSPDVKLSLEAEVLHREQTPYQKLLILKNDTFGTFMTLDGYVQVTEKDEFIYHDMICHPAFAVNPQIKKVLIIGGGDGGTAREVARYPQVEAIDMVEIDQIVCQVCSRFLPQTAAIFDNEPRLNLIFGDGVSFVDSQKDSAYDLIIVDSTDPTGPGEGLFTKDFYMNCNRILSANGILINQHEGAFYAEDAYELKKAHAKIRLSFPIARIYGFNIPTYASGYWYFGFASKSLDPLQDADLDAWQAFKLDTFYYNTDIHRASFALPNYVQKLLQEVE